MKIIFHQCGVGEFISIQSGLRNILIDAAFRRQYSRIIKPFLIKRTHIDLWILTHTDEDHIGGIIELINRKDEDILLKKVERIWFNWSPLEIRNSEDYISVRQGIRLRDKLQEMELLPTCDFASDMEPIFIGDIRIDILSPSTDKLELSKVKWRREEERLIGATSDYFLTIEELLENEFAEDTSLWNSGSIAVLLTSEGKRVMLLADAHPSVIAQSLRNEPFNCIPENPVRIDCVKVSHHGSKGNTSYELLDLIDCTDWVFCADGSKYGLPHKECICRIINQRKQHKEPTRIILNHDIPTFEQIFGVDENPMERYNFELVHLKDGVYEL